MRSRVLIADDHELVSQGIERILENDFDIVGVVADGRKLLAELRGCNRMLSSWTSQCRCSTESKLHPGCTIRILT